MFRPCGHDNPSFNAFVPGDHMIISLYDHVIIWSNDDVIDEKVRIFLFQRPKIKCCGSCETCFGKVSGQSELSSGGKRPIKIFEKIANFRCFFVEKWNVGDRLKRVLAKFEADRSWFWGVNGRSKFVGYGVGPFLVPYTCRVRSQIL